MVNFGYGPGMKYWREDKKYILAKALNVLVQSTKFDLVSPYKNMDPNDEDVIEHVYPYVEVDQLYPGVCIRKITHLTEDSQRNLVENAEEVYRQVMLPEEAK